MTARAKDLATYAALSLCLTLTACASGASVKMTDDGKTVVAKIDGQSVMTYYSAPNPLPMSPAMERVLEQRKTTADRYALSAYISEVRTPGGLIVTDDFPLDHPHHKGIWGPWTRTVFDGRSIDFWNTGAGKGMVRCVGAEAKECADGAGVITAQHEFVDLTRPGGLVALKETWTVTVRRENNANIIDLLIEQRCATDKPLVLEKYHYGGLGFRGAKEWKGENYVLINSEGKTYRDGNGSPSRWTANGGKVDGKWATVVILCHPSNERHPTPIRVWDQNPKSVGSFIGLCPVAHAPMTLEPGKTYTFRYRFVVYDGEVSAERAEDYWKKYAGR